MFKLFFVSQKSEKNLEAVSQEIEDLLKEKRSFDLKFEIKILKNLFEKIL